MPFTGTSRRVLVPAAMGPPLPATEAGKDVEQLVHLLLPVPAIARADGVGHAGRDVAGEEEPLHLLHRALDGGELEEDVHAVLVLLHHPLDALHLALDTAEPAQRLAASVLVDHGASPLYPTGVLYHGSGGPFRPAGRGRASPARPRRGGGGSGRRHG